MKSWEIISKLFKKYPANLAVTYTLFSLEMIGSLLRPFFLGVAVNDLIKGSYHGLIVLSIVHFCWLIIGTIRHMYDTRTFSTIYTALVTQFLSRRKDRADISTLSAHATLSRELIDFLETDFPYVIEAFYNIIGSLILLCFYESQVVLICFAILLPVLVISYFYGKKMSRLNQHKNDELEKQVMILSSGQNTSIKTHYDKLRKWQIKISDKEAWNFGIIELMVLVVIGGSLIITSNIFGTTILAGNLIGIYNYVLKFVSGLDTIPYTVQRMSSLNDIANRMALQEDDFPGTLHSIADNNKTWKQGSLKLSA